MSEALAHANIYTEEDYYNLPENVRAELIDGQIYYMSAPSRIHQEILMFLSKTIANYIDSKKFPCKVYPAPFAVKLFSEDGRNVVEPDISVIYDPNKLTNRGCTGAPDWIVNPMNRSVYVYFLEEDKFQTTAYTLQDKIKANIYNDLWIDFTELDL